VASAVDARFDVLVIAPSKFCCAQRRTCERLNSRSGSDVAVFFSEAMSSVVKLSLNCHSMLTGRSYKLSVRARR